MQQELSFKDKQLEEMQSCLLETKELLEVIKKDSEQKDLLIKTLSKVKDRYQ